MASEPKERHLFFRLFDSERSPMTNVFSVMICPSSSILKALQLIWSFMGTRLSDFTLFDVITRGPNGELLDNSLPVGELGLTEDVPLSIYVRFPPCDMPFYSHLHEAKESADRNWLTFAEPFELDISTDVLKKMYIRASFRSLADYFLTNPKNFARQKAVLTGTPGVGKSVFLFYLLWRLLKEGKGKRVLFVFESRNIYFDGKGGVFDLVKPPTKQQSFWKNDLWLLFDGKGKSEFDIAACQYNLCNSILSTSPRRGLYNDFKKSSNCIFLFMPIWSREEVKLVAMQVFPAFSETWSARFDVIGGVPRHVFSESIENPVEWLTPSCADCDIGAIMRMAGNETEIGGESIIVHKVVHMHSVAPFTKYTLVFASETVLQLLSGILEKKKSIQLLA